MKKIVNCTPHDIVLALGGEKTIVFKPSGIVPRVEVFEKPAEFELCCAENSEVSFPKLHRYHESGKNEYFKLPAIRNESGEVTGLPESDGESVFIVSRLVFEATDRRDVICPDTGPTAIRENGKIIGVIRFVVK